MDINIISVVTNPQQYKQLFTDNPHLKAQNIHLHAYDNNTDNQPIPARYNHFIDTQAPKDTWLVFCHQDFEFLTDPSPIFEKLDPTCIYGPIGVQLKFMPALEFTIHTYRWHPSIHIKKDPFVRWCGQIYQGAGFTKVGSFLKYPTVVDTVDCCCVIVHASLISKLNLRFDPVFDFHLYSEDFSLNARQHGVQTKAVQIPCRHYSGGNVNELFWQKYDQLLAKYPHEFFMTTCAGSPQKMLRRLLKERYDKIAPLWTWRNIFGKTRDI